MFAGYAFDNRFVLDLPGDPSPDPWPRPVFGALWSRVRPTPVRAPRLLAWSQEVAADLGLDPAILPTARFVDVMGGNTLLPGMDPFASNYGGHQFGHWAGQLGDGRAISLGELRGRDGRRHELQLKGAGPTPYSRSADGRAVLRSSIREFLCSEAMHHLGVPTTRALCLVGTGEDVVRDMLYDGHPRPEPGAVVCRVAPSFVRFGHFELPASRGDVGLLERLLDFVIRRDFADLVPDGTEAKDPAVRAHFFQEVCERTARMVAAWMRWGFVHGVMNTDNMSILGLTIDYGPYGWVDDFDPSWTPNTTDAQGRRYRFGHQPDVAWWNLTRLAQALYPCLPDEDALRDGLRRFVTTYGEEERRTIQGKLGLRSWEDDDVALMQGLVDLLHRGEVDMTLFFRGLSGVVPDGTPGAVASGEPAPDLEPIEEAFYDERKREAILPELRQWLLRWGDRLRRDGGSREERRRSMQRWNPRYVLRNYLAQQVIDQAEGGDPTGIDELLDVLRQPFLDQPGRERFAGRRPDWARNRAGCSMLSCSS